MFGVWVWSVRRDRNIVVRVKLSHCASIIVSPTTEVYVIYILVFPLSRIRVIL